MPWEHVAYKIDRIYATVAEDSSVPDARVSWLEGLAVGSSSLGVVVERDDEAGTEIVATRKCMIKRRTR
jgi:hypothetical protein